MAEPVGAVEIAERLGVEPGTVHRWVQRGLLPEPRWRVSGNPAWEWQDVRRWAIKTARLFMEKE
jgi:predicted site-specific integrase-resolvase